jgi:isopentenyl diphosphate isomerase/L-lactate dehydrogenase-like FMN-dependent dehydrogenase
LINVKNIDLTTRMFNTPVSFPLYVTATALGKLAHPTGEIGIVEGATREDVIYMLPTLASCSLDDMLEARDPEKSKNWMQLYVNADRKRTLATIKKAEKAGCKALCITVDAPMLGRRERDMRNKFTSQESSAQKGDNINRNQVSTRRDTKQQDDSNSNNSESSSNGSSSDEGGEGQQLLADRGHKTDARGSDHFESRGYSNRADNNVSDSKTSVHNLRPLRCSHSQM